MIKNLYDRLVIYMFLPYLDGFTVKKVKGFGVFLVDRGSQRMTIYIPWWKALN
jgi:hypothetical protein